MIQRWLTLVLLVPFLSRAQTINPAIVRATRAVESATPRAQSDPARPIYHVTAPAQWINDPNGPLFYKGNYHMFYQLHPFSDEGGAKHWGHVRSRDLATWEHLPIALWPSNEAGEGEVWSGCAAINGKGEPMLFYTSIGQGKNARTHAEQWVAVPTDNDLIGWRKHPANPILTEHLHGNTKIYDWRDPFIFHHENHTYMVLGGSLNDGKPGKAVVALYEAKNDELTRWDYRGILFQHPDANVITAECPNFFQVGKRWVLFISPYGKVQYFIGDFDPKSGRFEAKTRGLVDHSANFYAPNTLLKPDGNRIVWGWIMGFPGGRGWNGCLTIPRVLSVSREGDLIQKPAPQLTNLRGKPIVAKNVRLNNGNEILALPKTNTFEISAEIELKSAKSVGLRFKNESKDSPPFIVSFNGSELQAGDVKAPLKGKKLDLRFFVDRSVVEIFANDKLCATRVIPLLHSAGTLEVFASEGEAVFKRLDVWPMRTIWK